MRVKSPVLAVTAAIFLGGCSTSDDGGGDAGHGGAAPAGGQAGGAALGGHFGSGGNLAAGGSTGGAPATGGSNIPGGAPITGGAPTTAGAPTTGGSTSTSGGMSSSTSGASSSGGGRGNGGQTATGGNADIGGAAGSGGATGSAKRSDGCGKTPSLKNSTSAPNQNTLTISGANRQYLVRWPANYDNTHAYRLILGFHGAGGSDTDIGPSYFGLFSLSNNSTIFVAPSATGGIWNASADLVFVDEILKTVEAELCVDTSRVELEGFSQGGAMVAVLACQRPGVFRAAVGHSRGGLAAPTTCQPIPYLGSLGLHDIGGNSQATQTDAFAKWNACTLTRLPLAPTGGHVCTNYTNCPGADPVIFCSFDGPHTPSPTDAGKTTSWMPQQVWTFFSQF